MHTHTQSRAHKHKHTHTRSNPGVTGQTCAGKNAGFKNFLSEHRGQIEARLRRESSASAKVTKAAVDAEARRAWALLDEEEQRVYSL